MNKSVRFLSSAILCCLSALACVEMDRTLPGTAIESSPIITVKLPSGDTKTAYSFEDGLLKAFWSEGDMVSVVPDRWTFFNAGLFEVTDPGAAEGKFKQTRPVGSASDIYGVYYPGGKIQSHVQFMNFSYTGQVQSKDNPMAHLGAYHSMRKEVTDYSVIDFSGADQSSCMRFLLSGMTFHSPSKITLTAIKGGAPVSVFYENNIVEGTYTYYPGYDEFYGDKTASSLMLELDGYGDTGSLTAWMMMANRDVILAKGTILRVKVQCSDGIYCADIKLDSNFTLEAGHCHTLEIDSAWTKGGGDVQEYPYEGEVVTLQQASRGNGIDLVIMGDGFIAEDFDNGTYDMRMRQVYDRFFSVLPQAALKDLFNVYYVKAVSPERLNAINTGLNGAINTDTDTKFSTTFTPNSTSVSGDGDRVLEYASKALVTDTETRMRNVTVVVLANQDCRAGTCYQNYYLNTGTDYGMACAYAFCSLGRTDQEGEELIHHEVDGHGFGKLADEYYSISGQYNSGWWNNLKSLHNAALYRNVDIHVDEYIYGQWGAQLSLELTTPENVLWHDMFGTVNQYESSSVESLGVFQGGYTHDVGFCRPTENAEKSIMNSNRGRFNAPSRRAILYRAWRLSGLMSGNCYGTQRELDAFMDWDASVFLPDINASVQSQEKAGTHALMEDAPQPLAPPVLRQGHWEGERFIVEKIL